MKFVLYTVAPSPHQFPLAREIVSKIGTDHFRYIYQEALSVERKRQGLGIVRAFRGIWTGFDEIYHGTNYLREEAKFWHLSRRFLYLPFAYPTYLRGTVDKADGRHHVVFMAHMGRGYGVFDVLKAFEWVSRLKPKSHLDLIGGGPDLEEVRHWVATHGLYSRISVYGYVREEELDGLFSCAAAFVAPLHDSVQDWARCPSKVFYYIPYNKPIVTCRIGDPFENLKQYAIYYSADDVDDMARAIITALERSVKFAYPCGFIETHSWNARAKEFERRTENE